jgi:hypothetical protein
MLEINGKGWSESISSILAKTDIKLIITVRNSFLEEVKKKWDLKDPVEVNVSETDTEKKLTELVRLFSDSSG